MRTAKYTILCRFRPGEARPENWPKVLATTEALLKDGFTLETQIRPVDDLKCVVKLTGTAGPAIPRKHRVVYPPGFRSTPGPVTLKKCQKMAAQAKRAAVRPGILCERQEHPHDRYWIKDRLRQKQADRRVGRLVARAKARGEKTISVVALKGGDEFYRVFEPETVERVIEGRKQHVYPRYESEHGPTLEARKEALADYQYWRELELLSGQRQHWKPGLTDENLNQDDGVSSAA